MNLKAIITVVTTVGTIAEATVKLIKAVKK